MANLSFNDVEFNSNQNDSNQLGFFSLANDGDEAIVRFMHDSVDSFDIISTHDVTINGKYRKVSCLRTPKDNVDVCPLCASGDAPRSRIYIHLIEYVRNNDGTVTALPKVWERSINYAKTLKSYLDNYGPLSDIVCKVIRHGAKGSLQTTYEIVPNLAKSIYPDSVYVKLPEPFENYTALGRIVLDKTYDEIVTYMQTGNFPERVNSNNDVQHVASVPQFNVQPPVQQYRNYNEFVPPVQPQYNDFMSNQAPPLVNVPNDFNSGVQRPNRRY